MVPGKVTSEGADMTASTGTATTSTLQSMSAEQNIETARQMYEAFGRGDVQAILDRVTDDVDWSTDAAIESAPWYGPKHGKDELVSFFEGIATTGPVTDSPRWPSP